MWGITASTRFYALSANLRQWSVLPLFGVFSLTRAATMTGATFLIFATKDLPDWM
jgi:hypothetical protein